MVQICSRKNESIFHKIIQQTEQFELNLIFIGRKVLMLTL